MEDEMMPQGDDQIVDEIIGAVNQLMEMAGPEWTLEAITALAAEAQKGGEQPETMSQGGPASMPPMAAKPGPRNAFAKQ